MTSNPALRGEGWALDRCITARSTPKVQVINVIEAHLWDTRKERYKLSFSLVRREYAARDTTAKGEPCPP